MHKLVSLAVQRGMTWNPVEKTVWKYLSDGDNRKLNACLSACRVAYTPHIAIIKPRKQMNHHNMTLYYFIAANSGLMLKQSWTFVDIWVPPDCLNYCNPRLPWSSWCTAIRTGGFVILVLFPDFSAATALDSCMLNWECKKDHPSLSCLVSSISPTFHPFIWVQLYLHSETTWENVSVRPLEWIKVAFNYLHHWPHEAG